MFVLNLQSLRIFKLIIRRNGIRNSFSVAISFRTDKSSTEVFEIEICTKKLIFYDLKITNLLIRRNNWFLR